MADFRIKINAVKSTVDAEERIRRELENIQQSIREISGGLVIQSASVDHIKRNLDSLAGRVEGHRESLDSMKNALEKAAGLYEKTEKKICGNTEERIKTQEMQMSKTGSSLFSGLANLFGKIFDGLFSPVTTAWNTFFWPAIEGVIQSIIGKGEVSEKQPTASWAGATHNKLMEAAKSAAEKAAEDSRAAAAIADLKAREGTILADINGEFYTSNRNISYKWGYHGQCTWYAYGRFMEVTGIALNSAKDAKTWLVNNANDSRVKITYGWENIQWPAIAVSESGGGGHGHVMFIEGVEYNTDGTPVNVYLTEANTNVKPDGILQKLPYNEFKNKRISGYITAA